MSFSPRTRPTTVNLAFSDPDVTDSYLDDVDRSSNNASSPRHRHPLGDSPLSGRGYDAGDATGSSPGRFGSSRAGSSQVGSEANHSSRIRSNLDKLLDLLDEDDHDQVFAQTSADGPSFAQGSGERTAMSTPPPSSAAAGPSSAAADQSNYTPRATHSRKSASYSVPGPSYPPPEQTPISPDYYATRSESGRNPPQHTVFNSAAGRPPLSARGSSALELLQRANGFAHEARAGLPDSPSPRPGSVAALRRSDMAPPPSGRSAGLMQDEGAAGLVSGFSRMAVNGDAEPSRVSEAADGRSEGSLDSIARVAEAAQREFDEIISDTTQPDGRPASRMRSAPTPSRTALSEAPRLSPYGLAAGETLAGGPAEQMNRQLVQELRDAQDYISYLQEELRAISEVVIQLREPPDTTSPEASQLPYREEAPPHRPTPRQSVPSHDPSQAPAQAALEIMQHTLASLPSLVDTSAPLDSVARTLSFTRRLDQLVYRTRDQRRDEDVFAERNLADLLRAVETWSGATG